jgi:hypothetical protein
VQFAPLQQRVDQALSEKTRSAGYKDVHRLTRLHDLA